MTKKLQMYSLCLNFKILNLMFSISYMCVFLLAKCLLSNHLCVLYVKAKLATWKHETELYLRNQISFSVSASIIGSSSLFPRGRSPYVL